VHNEYGGSCTQRIWRLVHNDYGTTCHRDLVAVSFRRWLRARYGGLNRAVGLSREAGARVRIGAAVVIGRAVAVRDQSHARRPSVATLFEAR
jgi:hypothetical protein